MNFSWLVVYLPLWTIWDRQLGWWHSQYDGNYYHWLTINNYYHYHRLMIIYYHEWLFPIWWENMSPCCGPFLDSAQPAAARLKNLSFWWMYPELDGFINVYNMNPCQTPPVLCTICTHIWHSFQMSIDSPHRSWIKSLETWRGKYLAHEC